MTADCEMRCAASVTGTRPAAKIDGLVKKTDCRVGVFGCLTIQAYENSMRIESHA